MIAHQVEVGNAPSLESLFFSFVAFIHSAASSGLPIHETERSLWEQVRALGREGLGLFLRLQGTGDLGPDLTLPDGQTVRRLDELHSRDYRSVFGDFCIPRTCYGSREGQKLDFVPLDNRLQLPQSDYSHLLQQWDQALGSEFAFARVSDALEGIVGLEQPVDSLERLNRQMAEAVEPFRQSRPIPQPQDEGELFVLTDDGKGIPMRRGPDDPAPKAHRNKGDKANKKRMAIVGAIYSVDRHVRTPEEVTAALFRDPRTPGEPEVKRPKPVGKHLWARLSRAADGNQAEPIEAVFGWQKKELDKRNPEGAKEEVALMDGQESLWDAKQEYLGEKVVEILDILHVTPRLWQAAHLFEKEGTAEARSFVRERVQRVLEGGVKGVVKGLRRMGTDRGLKGNKKETLRKVCQYLQKNAERMRYDEYLGKGYPIASGVIEGACRHYVKDRMERSGMRWSRAGAQAMLDVRSEYLNGDWQTFQDFRIRRETERLYPCRAFLLSVDWPLAV